MFCYFVDLQYKDTKNFAYLQIFWQLFFKNKETEKLYRTHVNYYADRLHVTSKYLSETVKKYSGYPANHWINRYAALDISRLLRNPNVTIQDLVDMFGFSSASHLNRYVKNQLGVNPNEIRQ